MLERRFEPEVMDTTEDAHDYDAMDHSTVNRIFVDDFLAFASASCWQPRFGYQSQPPQILDVGTGTALIPIELCRRAVGCHITAIDLAAEMLKLADLNIAKAAFQQRIQTELIDAKRMPFACDAFDAVISNSIVHHIPNPSAVLTEMIRVLRDRGLLFVRDLLRPNSLTELDHLVTTYAWKENAHSQQLFRDSLHAALSLDAARQLADSSGIAASVVTQTSDRHWTLAWAGRHQSNH